MRINHRLHQLLCFPPSVCVVPKRTHQKYCFGGDFVCTLITTSSIHSAVLVADWYGYSGCYGYTVLWVVANTTQLNMYISKCLRFKPQKLQRGLSSPVVSILRDNSGVCLVFNLTAFSFLSQLPIRQPTTCTNPTRYSTRHSTSLYTGPLLSPLFEQYTVTKGRDLFVSGGVR